MPEIICSRCPVCGGPPALEITGITPWFCIDDDCIVLGWDPFSSLADNLENAQSVDITDRRPW